MESPQQNIVWIVSYPKSGNTWFRLFLSSILNPDKDININNIDSTLISSSRIDFDRICGMNSSDLTLEEINRIRPQIYNEISSSNHSISYIKVHDMWEKYETGELFPSNITKCAILIVRNPFDLAISFSNHFGISIKEAIHKINNSNQSLSKSSFSLSPQLNQKISNWSKHFLSWVDISGLNVLVLRYEDMIVSPLVTFSRACDFLGINVMKSQVESSLKKCSFQSLKTQEIEKGFREKPLTSSFFFNEGRSNYWNGKLGLDDIKILMDVHYDVIERLDYSF